MDTPGGAKAQKRTDAFTLPTGDEFGNGFTHTHAIGKEVRLKPRGCGLL